MTDEEKKLVGIERFHDMNNIPYIGCTYSEPQSIRDLLSMIYQKGFSDGVKSKIDEIKSALQINIDTDDNS